MEKISHLPNHVAIVPDGNRRWAKKHRLPRLTGHRAGAENMWNLIQYLSEYPIKYVTVYGFSSENWSRPKNEVLGLFRLFKEIIDEKSPELHKKGIKLQHLGRLWELPEWLQESINRAIELTKNNTVMSFSVAFNYGGRIEIVDAVRHLVADGVLPQQIDEKVFSNYLYTNDLPEVDLLIRTGDELRLSNFLIWQTAYSEYYFTDVLWPDFGKEDVDKALLFYSRRQRRFGGD